MKNKDEIYHSYISNDYGTEKTTLIYDCHNKRIIEKLISYQLLKDDNSFIITDRESYLYTHNNSLAKIVNIEKGADSRLGGHTNDNEYLSFLVKKIEYNSYKTDIHFFWKFGVEDSTQKSIHTLRLEKVDFYDESRSPQIYRVRHKLNKNSYYKYVYDWKNPKKLIKIIEYKILIDFSKLNTLFNTVIDLLEISHKDYKLFFKKKVKVITDNLPNELYKTKVTKQDYFDSSFEKHCLIHSSITTEDLLYIRQQELIQLSKNIRKKNKTTANNV